jgi:hypothetical protein
MIMHPSIHTWSFRNYKEQNKGADITTVIESCGDSSAPEIDPAVASAGRSDVPSQAGEEVR